MNIERRQMSDRGADGSRAYVASAFARFGVFVAVALFFLWQEHRAHLLGALPWLLLLACLLMHPWMHRGHGKHQRVQQGGRREKQNGAAAEREHAAAASERARP